MLKNREVTNHQWFVFCRHFPSDFFNIIMVLLLTPKNGSAVFQIKKSLNQFSLSAFGVLVGFLLKIFVVSPKHFMLFE